MKNIAIVGIRKKRVDIQEKDLKQVDNKDKNKNYTIRRQVKTIESYTPSLKDQITVNMIQRLNPPALWHCDTPHIHLKAA